MLLYLGEEIICYNVSEKLTRLTNKELYYSLVRFFFCINVGKCWYEILENTGMKYEKILENPSVQSA